MYSWARFRVADLAVTPVLAARPDPRALAARPGPQGVRPEPRLARPVRGLQVHRQVAGQVRARQPRRQHGHGAQVRRRALPPHRRRQGQGRRLPDARPARSPPRPGDRDLHLRRAPGRPEPVAGDRAVHGGRGDVLARGPGRESSGDCAAGRPAGEARLQRPAGDLQEGHDGPPVRSAVQPGDLLGGRASTSTSATAPTRTSTAWSRTSAAARPTCTRAGPSSPRTSG